MYRTSTRSVKITEEWNALWIIVERRAHKQGDISDTEKKKLVIE